MKEILTKTVSVTVKDLLIGGGIVAGTSTLSGIYFGLKSRGKKIKKLKLENKSLENKYIEQGNNLSASIDKLKCEIGQSRLIKWSNNIPNKEDIVKAVSKSNLDADSKFLIIEKYTKLLGKFYSISSKYAYDHPDWCENTVKNILDMSSNILLGDNKTLDILVSMIKKQNKDEEETAKIRREEEAAEAQRKHELALKEKDKEYLETYLNSVENMKEMEANVSKAKTKAFAEVAKSALDNLNKKKEE